MNNNTDKRPYAVKLLEHLLKNDHSETVKAVGDALKNIETTGYMPAFFWRHTLYSDKPSYISYGEGYTVHISRNGTAGLLSIEETLHFDYVLSNTSVKHGNLVFSAKKEKLVSDIAIDYKTFLEAFSELFVSIHSSGRSIRFPLFDYCHFLEDGSVEIKFSAGTAILYAADYLVRTPHTRNLFKQLRETDKDGRESERHGLKFMPLVRNMLSRNPRGAEIKIPISARYFDKAGIVFDPADETAFKYLVSNRKSADISLAMMAVGLRYVPNRHIFIVDKLNYSKPKDPQVFVNAVVQKAEENEERRRNEMLWIVWAKRVAKKLNVSEGAVIAQATGAEPITLSADTTIPSRPTSENKNERNATEEDWLNFETLDYTEEFDEVFDKHALPMDSTEKREAIFNEFKYIYQDLQEKRPSTAKYKDAKRCLANFLKTNYAINTGDAEHIVFVERMEKIAKNAGMNDAEIKEEFKKFKEYHFSAGNNRKNWVSVWNTWVKNVVARKKSGRVEGKGTQYEMRIALENTYQVQKIIDARIREIIKRSGNNPADFIRGRVEDKNITTHSVVIPPSIGKGSEVLFKFRDTKVQEEAEAGIWQTILNRSTQQANQNVSETVEVIEIR